MNGGRYLTGMITLLRLILRRDRIRIPLWMAAIAVFIIGSARSFTQVFTSEAELQARAQLMGSPMFIAFRGPGHGLDNYTIGAMVAHELLLLAAIPVAIMSVLMVVRHTRAEEESGRTELVRAAVVGPQAGMLAALVATVLVNGAIGLMLALALSGIIAELDMTGSMVFGMSVAAAGIVFAAVAAVTSQLTEHGRSASGLASIIMASAFVLRAVGDIGDGRLSWLSPFGWSQATRAYVNEQWWPLLIPAGVTLLLLWIAFVLADRRDFGAGLVPPRPGSPYASASMVHPVGFVWKLQRNSFVWWCIGLFVLGIVFGSVIGAIEEFLVENPQLADYIASIGGISLLESFLSMVVLLLTFMSTGYALQSALRSWGEETGGRAEPLLSTALSRWSWVFSCMLVTIAATTTVHLLGALGTGIAAASTENEAALLLDVLGAALAYLPAVWLFIGLVFALFGLVPRLVSLIWLVLMYAVIVGLMGELPELPSLLKNLSPFQHVPPLPGGEWSAPPLIVLSVLAVSLMMVGLTSFRLRDLKI